MKTPLNKLRLIAFSVILFLGLNSLALSQIAKGQRFNIMSNLKPYQQIYDTISTKNILDWCSNIGYDSYNALTASAGFYWPANPARGQTLVFAEGLQWGGLVHGEIRVGGVFYIGSSFVPMVVAKTDTGNVWAGIWKIRKNWERLSEGEYKDRLRKDYENWPVALGAPWTDVNGDGVYTKGIDKPKFYGDEQLYMAYNNGDSAASFSYYHTPPVNLEIHQLVYTFDSTNFLKDVIFKRYEIINKDTVTLKNFYATYWADDDIGMAGDEFEGCDSNLFLGYQFNAFSGDAYYKPVAPAIGHAVLHGLESNGKNLMMSAFGPNFKASYGSYDPPDSAQYYNVIRGLLNNGEPFRNPFSDEPSRYPMSGDPDRRTGWFEGSDWPPSTTFGIRAPYPSDRRYYICSGPIDFAPGDTQTVVIAEVVAIGDSNTNSVTQLRKKTLLVQHFYGNNFITKNEETAVSVPTGFKLYQNYPNPFPAVGGTSPAGSGTGAPTTTIKYSVPVGTAHELSLRLTVYDILGREVATLVNERKVPGNYSVEFNAVNLPSGVYFYKLTAGSFTAIRKMVLLK